MVNNSATQKYPANIFISQIIKDIPLMLIISALSTFLLQSIFENPFTKSISIFVYNIFVNFVILFLCRNIFRSLKWGIRTFSFGIWLFATINFLVLEFRSTPFLPWDIYSWQTAANVVANYSFPFSIRYFLSSLGFLLIFLYPNIRDKIQNRKTNAKSSGTNQVKKPRRIKKKTKIFKKQTLAQYLSLLLLSVILLSGMIFLTKSDFLKKHLSLNTTLFNSKAMARDNGYLTNFIFCTRYLSVEKPDGYKPQKAKEIIEEINPQFPKTRSNISDSQVSNIGPDKVSDTIVNRKTKFGLKPDIVVVMSEAFCDLKQLADFETNIDYLPFYRNFNENTKKGTVYSSVIGGNTASSEFEFLTGMTMGFLPSGSIAYMQFIQEPMTSIVSLLKDQGYYTTAMHPYYKSGWNRPQVYNYFGFDQVKFDQDFVNQAKVRKYISDKALFDEILMELDEGEGVDRPQFIFAVSMQNHGGYTDIYDNFTPDVKVTSTDSQVLDQYLSLIKETDQRLQEFIQTLNQRQRPTILLFFGDHQPNDYTVSALKTDISSEEWQEKRRKANYLLWANYPLIDLEEQDYSNNYLGNLLLQEARIPYDRWYDFLTTVQHEYPIINDAFYYDQTGQATSIEDQNFPDKLNDYAILQYEYLFGKNFEKIR